MPFSMSQTPLLLVMLLLVLLEAMMTLLLLLLLLLNEWQCVEQTRICLGLRAGL